MKKRLLGIALLLAAAATAISVSVALARPASGTVLKISADKIALKFNVSKLKAKAGKITIIMTNPSPLQHNVAVEGKSAEVKGKVVGKGGVSKVTLTLKKGTYEFYCTVPGHRAAGMKGKLTVT